MADRLAALDALRVDHPEAVDILWFHLGPHAWMTLVGERSWCFSRAQTWLADTARQALLKNPAEVLPKPTPQGRKPDDRVFSAFYRTDAMRSLQCSEMSKK